MDIDKDKKGKIGLAAAVLLLGFIIILPISFSYVEFYEYGLTMRRSTGKVDTSRVYAQGRYLIGPDKKFIKYQADAHFIHLDQLSIFSKSITNTSIGLEFIIDVDLTYFLIEEEVGLVHREMARSYPQIIQDRIKTGIKNEAIFVSFTEYFQDRMLVESRFRTAVEETLAQEPPLHCRLDQFHLGRIRIPDLVYLRQLESVIQNERNDKEKFLQEAQVERELTKVEVNKKDLETTKLLRTTEAEASLIRVTAKAEAEQMKSEAVLDGIQNLFETVGIESQDQRMAYAYIRALNERENLDLNVGYLDSENVVKTVVV